MFRESAVRANNRQENHLGPQNMKRKWGKEWPHKTGIRIPGVKENSICEMTLGATCMARLYFTLEKKSDVTLI